MGSIEIFEVIRKRPETGACGTNTEWKTIFKFRVEGSMVDRITVHPGEHGGIDVIVNTSAENAVYSFPMFKEILATVGGLVEVYFTGEYERTPL